MTDRADVVFPVAAVAEKPGTFVNWEGRAASFPPALSVPAVRTDLQVLAAIADAMDVHLGLPDNAAAIRELQQLTSGPARSAAAPHRGVTGSPPGQTLPLCGGFADPAAAGEGSAGYLA